MTISLADGTRRHDVRRGAASSYARLLSRTPLEAFDADTFLTLDNAYLDSPPSIAVLLVAMEQLGAEHFVLVENTNSGTLQGDDLMPTTSYIVGYYTPTALPGSVAADTPQ